MSTMVFLVISLVVIFSVDQVFSHSWMSCPRSFNPSPDRGGHTDPPCEKWSNGAINNVKAGDRLKIGWTSNNHGGGYSRIALVPEGQHNDEKSFKQNVIKFACYGHDQRPGKYQYGDCKHPCNARPGCEYQADILDIERYDTTITIPNNLQDGKYVIQLVMLVGNAKKPYYSCAKLSVTGGNPGLQCQSRGDAPTYPCLRSGGPPQSKIMDGTKEGNFCYHSDRQGNVDDRIREVPVNVECDPRISCGLSIAEAECKKAPGMTSITDPWNPKQECGGPVTPPPPPTCSDGSQNQGEIAVDCGGPNCPACATPPPTMTPPGGDYAKNINHKMSDWGTGFTVNIAIDVARTTNNWRLTVQYDKPINVKRIWSAKIVYTNSAKTIYTISGASWNSNAAAGRRISFGLDGTLTNGKATPVTMIFEPASSRKKRAAFTRFSLPIAGETCEDILCTEGLICEEEVSFPCRGYPCSRFARCIRKSGNEQPLEGPQPLGRKKRDLPNRQLLVGYWGQNAAGSKFGQWNWERDLRHFCNNYNYDIYVIAFVHRLFDVRNKDRLPGMNFAHHCGYIPDANYPGIFECASISGAIRDCQRLGKKVIISLGGDTCDGTLGSASNARKLAYNIWHMFLGGQGLPGKRPFLRAVLDGVDLDIEIGSYKYYPDFVREIRRLMRTDSSRRYLITAAPQCPFPDAWMGPQTSGSALHEVGHEFDYLFMQFYNNYCYPGDKYFLPVMDQWLNWANSISNGPLILLGLPAGTGAAGKPHYYFPPDQLAAKYRQIRDKPGVGGIMFWECSWDQNNLINNKHYSEYAFELVSGGSITPPTHAPITTQTPATPTTTTTKAPITTRVPTKAPVTTKSPTKAPVTTKPPSGPVDCSSSPDGYYPHPSDCAKFVVCAGGVAYVNSCPPGLKYNKAKKYCDWPANVMC